MLDAKLGDRSIALSKGLFVYDKQLFDEDDARAQEIQEMRQQTYVQEEDDDEAIDEDYEYPEEEEFMEAIDGDVNLDHDEDAEDTF